MSTTGASLRETPLHTEHVAAGAKLVDFAGWSMPLQYESVKTEHMAVREAAGMFDVSHMGRLEFTGAAAETALQRLVTADVAALSEGDSQYCALCQPDGGIIDDLLVYKLGDERFLAIVNASNHEVDLAWMREHGQPLGAAIEDISEAYALIAVQGPVATEILESLAGAELPPRYKVERFTIDGTECIACTTGYTGEPGAELLVPAGDAAALWRSLADADVKPCGLGARDTLRLEACLPLYGNDLDRNHDPITSRLRRFVDVSTGFIGAEAVAAVLEAGPAQKLVPFVIDGKGIARQGNPIAEGGVVTSGTLSPLLGVGIGLAYVDSALAEPGTPLSIDVRRRERPAKVVPPPFTKLKEQFIG